MQELLHTILCRPNERVLIVADETGNVNVLIKQIHLTGQPKPDSISIRHHLIFSPQPTAPVVVWFFEFGIAQDKPDRMNAYFNIRDGKQFQDLTRLISQKTVLLHFLIGNELRILRRQEITAPLNVSSVCQAALDWDRHFLAGEYNIEAAKAAFCSSHTFDEIARW